MIVVITIAEQEVCCHNTAYGCGNWDAATVEEDMFVILQNKTWYDIYYTAIVEQE